MVNEFLLRHLMQGEPPWNPMYETVLPVVRPCNCGSAKRRRNHPFRHHSHTRGLCHQSRHRHGSAPCHPAEKRKVAHLEENSAVMCVTVHFPQLPR